MHLHPEIKKRDLPELISRIESLAGEGSTLRKEMVSDLNRYLVEPKYPSEAAKTYMLSMKGAQAFIPSTKEEVETIDDRIFNDYLQWINPTLEDIRTYFTSDSLYVYRLENLSPRDGVYPKQYPARSKGVLNALAEATRELFSFVEDLKQLVAAGYFDGSQYSGASDVWKAPQGWAWEGVGPKRTFRFGTMGSYIPQVKTGGPGKSGIVRKVYEQAIKAVLDDNQINVYKVAKALNISEHNLRIYLNAIDEKLHKHVPGVTIFSERMGSYRFIIKQG